MQKHWFGQMNTMVMVGLCFHDITGTLSIRNTQANVIEVDLHRRYN